MLIVCSITFKFSENNLNEIQGKSVSLKNLTSEETNRP